METEAAQKHDTDITYKWFFTNRYVVTQLLALIIAQCGVTYITPSLAVNLHE